MSLVQVTVLLIKLFHLHNAQLYSQVEFDLGLAPHCGAN